MKPLPLLLATVLTVASGLPAVAHAAEQSIGGNVESLLEFARDRHPEFAAMRHEAAAATARVPPAGALPDPVFGVELRDFTNEVKGGSANVLPARVGVTRYTINQSLPWFGKRDLKREIAAAGAGEAEGRAAATWADLAWQIKQTYAQYYQQVNSIQYGRENLVLLDQLTQIVQVRYAGGLVPQQDAIRAQTERTALQSELAMLEGENEQAAARMHTLLGRPPAVRLLPPERLRPLPPAAQLEIGALETRIVERNPRLAADAARIEGAEKTRELTYKNRYPDFNVGMGSMQEGNRVASWDLMFEVNIPLQQESRRAQELEAERMLDAAKSRKAVSLNQMLAELAESLAALRAARRVEELVHASLLPQAELTLQSALTGYGTGKVDFATVLDAQRQRRKAKEDLVKARVNQQMRLADVERVIGEEL